jgi:hypothetical protein
MQQDEDFFVAGGDSLLVVRLVSKLREDGVVIGPVDVLRGRTYSGIMARLSRAGPAPVDGVGNVAAGGDGPVLLPTQRRWLANRFVRPNHFNLGWVFEVPDDQGIGGDEVRDAVQTLARRHEALRTRYALDGNGSATAAVLADPPEGIIEELIVADDAVPTVLADAQRRQRLAEGRVLAVTWLPAQRLLLVAAHHLTLDGYSVGLLADELDALLLRRTPTTFAGQPREQAAALARWLDTPQAAADARRWHDLGWADVGRVPENDSLGGRLPSMKILSVTLDSAGTLGAQGVAVESGISTDLLLTAAASQSIAKQFDLAAVSVDAYHHGRDPLPGGPDLGGTIGYLQSTFPIVLRRNETTEWLRSGLEDIRRVPMARFGFDLLRFGTEPDLGELPSSGVRMNFRGRMGAINKRPDGWLRRVGGGAGRRAPEQTEPYVLMLEGDLIDGGLVFSVKFSTDHVTEPRIRSLIEETLQRLRDLA